LGEQQVPIALLQHDPVKITDKFMALKYYELKVTIINRFSYFLNVVMLPPPTSPSQIEA